MRSGIRDRNILFLSPGNACLSFIAGAIAKRLLPPKTQVSSAGLNGGKVAVEAVRVLIDVGIDVSTQETKRLDVIPTEDIDLIITLGNPGGFQPTVSPRTRRETWEISDPCREPKGGLDAFRQARDEINNRIGGLFLDYWRNLG